MVKCLKCDVMFKRRALIISLGHGNTIFGKWKRANNCAKETSDWTAEENNVTLEGWCEAVVCIGCYCAKEEEADWFSELLNGCCFALPPSTRRRGLEFVL